MYAVTAFFFKAAAFILVGLYSIGLPVRVRGMPLSGQITVTAHSGCMDLPDNSLEAMEAGVQAGAQIVEFDLQYNDAGEPVLSHDAPAGQCVTLQDAFAFLAAHPDVRANVDVKDTSRLECVEPMAQEAGVLDRIFFTGLEERDIPIAREKCPSVPYYLNTKVSRFTNIKKLADKVRELGALGVNVNKRCLSPRLTRVFHDEGLLVSVWTVDKKNRALVTLMLQPDNVTTRRPDLIWSLLEKEIV